MSPRRILFSFLAATVFAVGSARAQEPDGARPVGVVPPFRSEPAPPAWLRAASHATAFVDTRHYLYEVYSGPVGGEAKCIVRYVMLPEGNEAFREIEQVFLFDENPKHKPKALKPGEINFDPKLATWNKIPFKLVDRRDLMLP